jgi:hypothetical protein
VSEKHHLLAWILSVETARQHYRDTSLFTDAEGAKMLVDGLGLEFDRVSTDLNALDKHDPEWWSMGKIYAYRAQEKPFVHIDSDVFLWNPLPKRVESAPLFAQNPEYLSEGWYYYPQDFIAFVKHVNGWVPEELIWYSAQVKGQRGDCCGIFGGNQVNFIQYYANTAIKLIENKTNFANWPHLTRKSTHMMLVEQYMLAACIEYQRKTPDSHYRHYRDIRIEYLFDPFPEACNPAKVKEVGYTHLWGDAKRNRNIGDRLEKRVARDYPQLYWRCIEYLKSQNPDAVVPTYLDQGYEKLL